MPTTIWSIKLLGGLGYILAAVAGVASTLVGLVLAKYNPWILPTVMTLSIYPIYALDLKMKASWKAVAHVLIWAFASSVVVVVYTYLFPGDAGAKIVHGKEYLEEMIHWIYTGQGAEGDPNLFLKPKVIELVVFVVLTTLTGGIAGLFLGSYLLNYMNFYVGSLSTMVVGSRLPLLLVFSWPIYAILRVIGYVNLGVYFSVPLLRLIGVTNLKERDVREHLVMGLILVVFDFLLKATVANAFYQPMLKEILAG